MNEGYFRSPIPGLSLKTGTGKHVGLGYDEGDVPNEPGAEDQEAYGERGEQATAGIDVSRRGKDASKSWGKYLVLSVDVPQGACPGKDGCSRIWMYGSVAWNALRGRCQAAASLAATREGVSGEGQDRRAMLDSSFRLPEDGAGGRSSDEAESLKSACAVGDDAAHGGARWGLTPGYVCGLGPPRVRPKGWTEGRWQEAQQWNRPVVWRVADVRREV